MSTLTQEIDVVLTHGAAYKIHGEVYWYVGPDPTSPGAHVFACGNYIYESWERSLTDATRVPELDKTIPIKGEQ